MERNTFTQVQTNSPNTWITVSRCFIVAQISIKSMFLNQNLKAWEVCCVCLSGMTLCLFNFMCVFIVLCSGAWSLKLAESSPVEHPGSMTPPALPETSEMASCRAESYHHKKKQIIKAWHDFITKHIEVLSWMFINYNSIKVLETI